MHSSEGADTALTNAVCTDCGKWDPLNLHVLGCEPDLPDVPVDTEPVETPKESAEIVDRNLKAMGCAGLTEPELPASMADLLRRLAAGLDVLSEPLSWAWRRYGERGLTVNVHGLAAFESWRQWLGAPVAEPGEWTPSTLIGDGGMNRRYKTAVEWRGQPIQLTVIETRTEPETRSERRQRLAAEIARIDKEIGPSDVYDREPEPDDNGVRRNGTRFGAVVDDAGHVEYDDEPATGGA